MKKFFKDFKAFITRGNILDLAIGVIVGNAFSAIVTAFTNKIIMPLINWLLSLGGDGLDSAYTFLKRVETNGVVDLENSIYIDWGSFITAILNFLIIALTLFIILKVAMKSNEFFNKSKQEILSHKLTKEEKKELKEKGISLRDKEAIKTYREEKTKLAKETENAKLEEEKAKAEAERLANPTETDLLKEIRDLLKQNENTKVQAKSKKSEN